MWAEDHRGEYTWEDARDQGGIIMDVLDMNYPIRYLMYVANQYADFFPSDGDDDDIAHGDRLYSTSYTKSGKTDGVILKSVEIQKEKVPPITKIG